MSQPNYRSGQAILPCSWWPTCPRHEALRDRLRESTGEPTQANIRVIAGPDALQQIHVRAVGVWIELMVLKH